ncbi:hypothetical protein ACX8XN_04355 [Calditrichota bacterium GD2]
MSVIIPRIFMMMFSPFLVLLHDLRYSPIKVKKWSLIFFIVFFGSVINIHPQISGPDGSRLWFYVYTTYSNMSFSEFWNALIDILLFNPPSWARGDVYIHVLSYLTGSVLQLPGLFFVFVSFVYGYFFSSSIFKIITKFPRVKYPIIVYGIAIIFILWKSIEGINPVRTWTGLWVLFYGSLRYFETKKRRYLLLMGLPPFIHLGFFVLAIPAFIVALLGTRQRLYTIIFIFSFVVNINQQIFLKPFTSIPLGENRVKAYYVADPETFYSGERYLKSTWYLKYHAMGLTKQGLQLLIFIFLFSRFYQKKMNKIEQHLFSIGILLISLSNVTYFLYALYNRSGEVGGLFILASIVLFLQRYLLKSKEHKLKKVHIIGIVVSLILFIPFFFLKIAQIIIYMSIFSLILPPIKWLSLVDNISIRQVIGSITSK